MLPTTSIHVYSVHGPSVTSADKSMSSTLTPPLVGPTSRLRAWCFKRLSTLPKLLMLCAQNTYACAVVWAENQVLSKGDTVTHKLANVIAMLANARNYVLDSEEEGCSFSARSTMALVNPHGPSDRVKRRL